LKARKQFSPNDVCRYVIISDGEEMFQVTIIYAGNARQVVLSVLEDHQTHSWGGVEVSVFFLCPSSST